MTRADLIDELKKLTKECVISDDREIQSAAVVLSALCAAIPLGGVSALAIMFAHVDAALDRILAQRPRP